MNDSQATRILTRDETQTSAIAPGDVLRQRYRLDSEIGRGGMGIVFRATDLELMREVAVKVVSEAASSDARQRLIREARAAAALSLALATSRLLSSCVHAHTRRASKRVTSVLLVGQMYPRQLYFFISCLPLSGLPRATLLHRSSLGLTTRIGTSSRYSSIMES